MVLACVKCHHDVLCMMYVYSAQELKDHPYFEGIDWQQVYLQKYPPPLIPPRGEVNAADAFDIGSFDEEDTKGIKVNFCHDLLLEVFYCSLTHVYTVGHKTTWQ